MDYKLKKNVDTIAPVNCPACGCQMTKLFIPELSFHIDICVDGCGGIFFDNRELEQVQFPSTDVSELLKIAKEKTYIPRNQKETRFCGHCNSRMLKLGVGRARVEIDVCPNCGGKFLDNGELEAIRESYVGVYEKSIIEYALRHPKSFSVICNEVIRNTKI